MSNAIIVSLRISIHSNIQKYFSYALKFHFSASTENLLSPHPSHGENIKHQRLIQLLQEPHGVQSLDATKTIHALTITMGTDPTQPFLAHNSIMSKYSTFGDIRTAREVFDNMFKRNVVSYNTMISAYSRNGNLLEAWKLFTEMRSCGYEPTQFTFGGLLGCESLDIIQGFQLYALAEKLGLFHVDAFTGTALLGLLGRQGYLDEAMQIFDEMPKKNLVTLNCMISLLGQYECIKEAMVIFRKLIRSEMAPSESTFLGLLSGYVGEIDLILGEQVHGLVVKNGLNFAVSVCNSLINMYASCSDIVRAEKMFEDVPVKDVVSWNTIVGAMAKSERPDKALVVFRKMCASGVLPNDMTYVSALNCCTSQQYRFLGESIHAKVIQRKFESDVYIGSALLDFYVKCDKLDDARLCFDEISEKNVVSWNTLMLGYSSKSSSHAILLLQQMINSGYRPTEFSFSIAVKSCALFEVLQLHSLSIKMGYIDNAYVSSSLISSYAKNSSVDDALRFATTYDMTLPVVAANMIANIYNRCGQFDKTQVLFSDLENPDTISWNILIAACSRNGDYEEVFELFGHMRIARISPDNYTYVSLFSVCTKLCNLGLGSSLHGLIVKTDFKRCDTFVRNIMIDMYGKCGSLASSIKIFNEITTRNVISWTAIVSALGLHGYAYEALEKFKEMDMTGIRPDKVAFISVLSACRHVGLVKEGMELFEQMKEKYGVEPEMDHYLIAVDLLARYGYLREAEQLITGMPFPPNALIWRIFLEGCKKKRSIDDARTLAS
ncbi:pentatricopeptide repeat-containing protein At3g58590 [Nicotiana tabacum]|uniref:Pentatricopeptide repeat-containing protein At3g58590 n=2 Tax=Nicotiana TaxID=4085 RepID=A0A1S4A5G1_TOBAC|nr:PREDICTED: pentatricopeptide repeat-containing protein At3g58590 [Nicotiana sylvestris]